MGKEPDEGMEEEPDPSFEAAMPFGACTPWRVKSRFEIKISILDNRVCDGREREKRQQNRCG